MTILYVIVLSLIFQQCIVAGFFQCPDFGLRFRGELINHTRGFQPGWRYWQECSERCQQNRQCQAWTMVQNSKFIDNTRAECFLYADSNKFDRPNNLPEMIFYSGLSNCSEIIQIPPSTVYVPGNVEYNLQKIFMFIDIKLFFDLLEE